MDYEAKARKRAELVWSDIVLNSMNAEQATDRIAAAIREAVEGETKRCAGIADRYGNSDWNEDIHNEPPDVALGIETASRDIAAAIREAVEEKQKLGSPCTVCGVHSIVLWKNGILLGTADELCKNCFQGWYEEGIRDRNELAEYSRALSGEK